MKSKLSLIAALVVGSLAHASLDTPVEIINRTAIEQLSSALTVLVLTKNPDGSITPECSAIILSQREVLTAGHCNIANSSDTFVEYKDPKDSFRSIRVKVKDLRVSDPDHDDLMLLKLDESVKGFNRSLPIGFKGCEAGSEYISRGFGKDSSGEMTKDSRVATFSALDSQKFLHDFYTYSRDMDGNLAEEQYKTEIKTRINGGQHFLLAKSGHVCAGDSGSPVFCRKSGNWVLAGIMTSAYAGKSSIKRDANLLAFCEEANVAGYASLAEPQNQKLLEDWRHEMGESKNQNATANETKSDTAR